MDQKRPPQFVIIVKGAANTGKTALTHIIENALRSNGIEAISVAEDIEPLAYLNSDRRRGRIEALVRRQPKVLIEGSGARAVDDFGNGVIDREVILPHLRVYRYPALSDLTQQALQRKLQPIIDRELPRAPEPHNAHDDEFPMPHHHSPAVLEAAREGVGFVASVREDLERNYRSNALSDIVAACAAGELVSRPPIRTEEDIQHDQQFMAHFNDKKMLTGSDQRWADAERDAILSRDPVATSILTQGPEFTETVHERAHRECMSPMENPRGLPLTEPDDESFFNDRDMGPVDGPIPSRGPGVHLEEDIDHCVSRAHTD